MNEMNPIRGLTTVLQVLALVSVGALTDTAAAQTGNGAESNQPIEEIVVYGSRKIVQNQIGIKRDAVTIVDGMSADDIGDLPALSIGEALETITGASSHRENGGATEISIRGLGPFLGMTTFNGREATNGSGDRSVNFSQFPSELMSKLAIHKTQNASLIEGGVAGLIELETLKPLDYNKRQFQFDLKGNYNPDQQHLREPDEGEIGHRSTFSYIDQFDLGSTRFGISLGYQNSDTSNPESEVRGSSPTGSSIYACINDPGVVNEGFFRSSSGDCEDQVDGSRNQGYQTDIDPATGRAVSDGLDFAFAPSSRSYRQNDTSEEREAWFIALQFQPNDRWDINIDAQISERVQSELRHDLNFANQKRATSGVTGPTLVTSDKGTILSWEGTTAIESNSEVWSRTEDYEGYAIDVEYQFSDSLSLSLDYSSSKTTREELQILLRTQSDNEDIFNEDTPGGYRPEVSWNRASGIPQFVVVDFDVTDHTLFSDEYRVRIDSDVDRVNKVDALRLDFDWELDGGIVSGIEGGVRFSELEYLNLGGTRFTTGNLDDSSQEERDTIAAINQTCRNEEFPERSFLSRESSGPLITNIDSSTGQPTTGTGNSWATFDTLCVTNMILDSQSTPFAYPEQTRVSPSTTNVTEETFALYLMANMNFEFADRPIRGNFGVRIVDTKVKSVAYRTPYEIITSDGGFLSMQEVAGANLERSKADHDYIEYLPSLNLAMDLRDDLVLRGGVFRGMSRADPGDLGYNRSFSLNSSDDITDPDDLISNVSGSGNPFTDPLMTWNFDIALEWYPNDDSILAVGLYYKNFQGGFEQIRTIETFVVDGQDVNSEFTASQTSDDESDLYGIELTASHRFSYLPRYFSGLGAKVSYNYADSNFEFEDSNYGTVFVTELNGSTTQLTQGIVAPGNVPGFSEHVFSGQIYYQIGKLDAQVLYKYRSEYFQPYISNGTRLRYVDDVGVWEARLSYQVTDHIKVTLEGINLDNEPKQTFYYSDDNFGERNVYGPRLFLGVKVKF